MRDLTVSIIQTDTEWHAPEANLRRYDAYLATISGSDLVVLPEMFSTGFTMHAREQAEEVDGPSTRWLAREARRLNCVITGSLVIKDKGRYYNRLIWMRPDGRYESYDKRHLFRMANEHQTYTPGSSRLIVELNGWRICPMICYDLRFPAWSRNSGNLYDLLFFVANWPQPRHNAWTTLLEARAIENLSYVIGVNRIGTDDNALAYAGDSRVIDFKGQIVADCAGNDGVRTAVLSGEKLSAFREKFPAHLDADAVHIDASQPDVHA